MPWQVIDTGNRKKTGLCSLAVQRGSLLVVFPRKVFNGKQRTLNLDLADTPSNRIIAFNQIRSIQTDIDLGQFDPSLKRYLSQHRKESYLSLISEPVPAINLVSLWLKYFEYKKPTIKESTADYYHNSVTPYLEKAGIESPYQALELREWLLVNTTQSMTKRVLTYVNAAFNWGCKHGLVKGTNPYDGMPNELRHKFQDNAKANPFSMEEKQAIITAFATHAGNWNGRGFTGKNYTHYVDFVRFLFLTGCRPSEAVGLRWLSILENFQKISFESSLVQLPSGKRIRSDKSKTNRVREFPCNLELQDLLKKIRPKDYNSLDLVFPSPSDKAINYNNFNTGPWSKIVDPIKAGTTPYCCRDTFITEQILKGVNIALVAKWCDTSTATIERHYFAVLNTAHVLPL